MNHRYPLRTVAAPLLMGALLLLGACSPLSSHEQSQRYQLSPAEVETQQPLTLALRLETPSANRTLNSSRILVTPREQNLNAYPGARWTDNAPALLRDHLIAALRQSGAFAAVVDEGSRAWVDLELTSDLRAFHAEYRQGNTEVVIVLEAQLIERQSQSVVASQRFEVRNASDSGEVDSVVAALNRAANALSTELIDWSRTQASTR